jgi:uncharacterized protein YndB with AHSA1/START domain
MNTQAQDLTVRKSVTVNCSQERAFDVYTAGIAGWWPLETHSIGGMGDERPVEAVFESGVGGRLFERMANGEEHEWAKVLVWEPPHRFVIDWHVNSDNPPTEVEVTFTSEGESTRVELEHRGWERYGDQASDVSGGYNSGWESVLGRFVQAANEERSGDE